MRSYASLTLTLGLGLALAGCTDDVTGAEGGSESETETGDGDGDAGDGDGDAGDGDGDAGDGDGDPDAWDGTWPTLDCDPLVPSYCAFPLPNNVYTVADDAAETGLRVELSDAAVPVSSSGGVTDVSPFNTRDGFSPGINMVTHLPGAPSTAGSAIDGLTFLLGKSVKRDPASRYRCDAEGNLRIVFRRCSFEAMIEDSYLRILQYGGADTLVMRRLLSACEQLSTLAKHQSQRDAVWAFVEAINAEAARTVELPMQRRKLDAAFEAVRSELGRPSLPQLGSDD